MGTVTANQQFDILAPAFSDLSGVRPFVGDDFDVLHGNVDFLILRFGSGASYLFSGEDFDIEEGSMFGWFDGTVEGIDVIMGGDLAEVEDVSLDAVRLGNFIADGDGRGLWKYVLSGSDNITGSRFDDRIYGYAGNDTVNGGRANDVLRGGQGRDTLNGGPGNDKLHGGPGSDTLNGDTGRDVFIFDTALGNANRDVIVNFSSADDRIHLDNDIFKALSTPAATVLQADEYKENASGKATDADDRIIYNTKTGDLFYDPDGSGAKAALKFATLTGAPDLDDSDFFATG